jgi:hypothetical protein
MATLLVHGHSDDLVALHGIQGADEYTANSGDTWTGLLEAPNGETALLYVDYRKNGTWTVSLGLWDEDYTLPAWPMKLGSGDFNGYTVDAELTVPDGTTVKEYRP